MTSIRLPKPMEDRLDQLASLTQRSKSFFIKEALTCYLEDMEDAYIALERLTRPKRSFATSAQLLKRIKKKR